MKVDSCQTLSCLALRAPQGPNEYLNVNGPLQLGGSPVQSLGSLARAFNWSHKPTDLKFSGCIRNFTFNQKVGQTFHFFYYDNFIGFGKWFSF